MVYDKIVEIKELNGKVIKDITGLEKDSEEVRVFTECGQEYVFFHEQDCCESVCLTDFEGSKDDLVGGLIVTAEECTSESDEDSKKKPSEYSEIFTWAFYDIQTTKGTLWMRWLGESNGHYSESVSSEWANKPTQESQH